MLVTCNVRFEKEKNSKIETLRREQKSKKSNNKKDEPSDNENKKLDEKFGSLLVPPFVTFASKVSHRIIWKQKEDG